MGPANNSSHELPNRPKFSWDGKTVPWTDGHGPQDRYAESVAEWSMYHDLLPMGNANRYDKKIRGTILKSQLFGRPRDLVRSIAAEDLQSDMGVQHVVNAIYKRDTLTVLNDVYVDFNNLVSAKRGQTESFRNYDMRFAALVSKFNAHGSSLQLPESITAFMLMSSGNIDDSNRVSIMASAANELMTSKVEDEVMMMSNMSSADIVQNVKYETVASIIRQCERRDTTHNNGSNLKVHQGGFRSGRGRANIRYGNDRISRAKGKYACRQCGKFGHWKDDHNRDGSLKQGAVSSDNPLVRSGVSSGGNAVTNDKSQCQKDKMDPSSTNNSGNNSQNKVALGFTYNLGSSKTLIGNMSSGHIASFNETGPLVDDGAPYSAIGEVELQLVSSELIHKPELESKPDAVAEYDRWQYGQGDHSSFAKEIIGSVELFVTTDKKELISIRHLVIKGSSGWVIGRNVTSPCDIQHINGNALLLPIESGDKISMIDVDFHSYIPFSRFKSMSVSPSMSCLSAASSAVEKDSLDDWAKLKRVVDRVHKHVCGHAAFSDMRTLLVRNKLWNEHVQKYLTTIVTECSDCSKSSTPPPNRRVSLSSLDRNFNDVVCLDHFYLDEMVIFHAMDTASRFSAGHVVSSTSLEEAVYAFEISWLSQF